MTAKEKAIELFNKYFNIIDNCHPLTDINISAKQCAIIAVDEILINFGLLTNGKHHFCDYATIRYYEEVKKEIKKL